MFPGAVRGIRETPIVKVSDSDRELFKERYAIGKVIRTPIRTYEEEQRIRDEWGDHALHPLMMRGTDVHDVHSTYAKIQEDQRKRLAFYAPLHKDVGFANFEGDKIGSRQIQIPSYHYVKPPEMRNTAAFYAKITKKPEELYRKEFASLKQPVACMIREGYIERYFKRAGHGVFDFESEYSIPSSTYGFGGIKEAPRAKTFAAPGEYLRRIDDIVPVGVSQSVPIVKENPVIRTDVMRPPPGEIHENFMVGENHVHKAVYHDLPKKEKFNMNETPVEQIVLMGRDQTAVQSAMTRRNAKNKALSESERRLNYVSGGAPSEPIRNYRVGVNNNLLNRVNSESIYMSKLKGSGRIHGNREIA